MATFSTRLGLTKPAGTEAKQLSVINGNTDILDQTAGMVWVADGALPGKQFDGAIIKEITSKREFILRTDGLGGYTKSERVAKLPWAQAYLVSAAGPGASVSGWQLQTPANIADPTGQILLSDSAGATAVFPNANGFKVTKTCIVDYHLIVSLTARAFTPAAPYEIGVALNHPTSGVRVASGVGVGSSCSVAGQIELSAGDHLHPYFFNFSEVVTNGAVSMLRVCIKGERAA